jgi:hypothetical protein
MLLKVDNEPELREAQAALFNSNAASSAWLLLNYVGSDTIHFASGGENPGYISAQLVDDQIQYALVRLAVPGQTGRASMRDVFVQWIGPGVGIIEKGRKYGHVEDAKELLQPFHAEVYVTNRQRFDTET